MRIEPRIWLNYLPDCAHLGEVRYWEGYITWMFYSV